MTMDIKSVVLKTISENTKDGKTWGMWIMGYYIDGKPTSVKVIAGEKKVKQDNELWYVAKGMSVKDFAQLKPHYAEFAALSANQPPLPAPAPAPADELFDEAEAPF